MRYLLFMLCFLMLPACEWKKESQIRFGYRVAFQPLEGYTRCMGTVRNYLGFNRYHLDDVWCDYTAPGVQGSSDPGPSIVKESDMRILYWQTVGLIGPNYTPVTGSGNIPDIQACRKQLTKVSYKQLCEYKKYFNIRGKWVNAETGIPADVEEKLEKHDDQESFTGFLKI